jgi:hypothetical protein
LVHMVRAVAGVGCRAGASPRRERWRDGRRAEGCPAARDRHPFRPTRHSARATPLSASSVAPHARGGAPHTRPGAPHGRTRAPHVSLGARTVARSRPAAAVLPAPSSCGGVVLRAGPCAAAGRRAQAAGGASSSCGGAGGTCPPGRRAAGRCRRTPPTPRPTVARGVRTGAAVRQAARAARFPVGRAPRGRRPAEKQVDRGAALRATSIAGRRFGRHAWGAGRRADGPRPSS